MSAHRSERIIDLTGTCPRGSLEMGDEIRLTFPDEEWLLRVTRIRPFTVASGEAWVDWQASGEAVTARKSAKQRLEENAQEVESWPPYLRTHSSASKPEIRRTPEDELSDGVGWLDEGDDT